MEWRNVWIVRWMRQNISDPMIDVLSRGADPKTLSMSAALGMLMGVFPVYGVTALLCACVIAVLGSRCNAPTVMLVNVIATPVQVILVVPFLRAGEFAVHGDHFPLTKDSFWKALTGQGSTEVFLGLFHAILGWAICAPFIMAGLYYALLPFMRFAVQRYRSDRADGLSAPLIKDQSVSPTLSRDGSRS